MPEAAASKDQKIEKLERFLVHLRSWSDRKDEESRAFINENKASVRRILAEVGCYKTITIAPPPAVGGLIYRDADVFDLIFDPPYFTPVKRISSDMIQEAIGAIRIAPESPPAVAEVATLTMRVTKGFAFVAMPMDKSDPTLVDVLDAIKEVASRCGLTAQRVDEDESNDRITDRILDSIARAQFVIADLTNSRPNVFFEAGYAHALGKVPVYIAREGTPLEFDLKDYPVIFFSNIKSLKEGLENRLRAIAGKK